MKDGAARELTRLILKDQAQSRSNEASHKQMISIETSSEVLI